MASQPAAGLLSSVAAALHAVAIDLPSAAVAALQQHHPGADAEPTQPDSPTIAEEVPAAAATAEPPAELRSAADCEAYLKTLPGGAVALEQATSVTASLNQRRDVMRQEELTYLLQVSYQLWMARLEGTFGTGREAPAAAAAAAVNSINLQRGEAQSGQSKL